MKESQRAQQPESPRKRKAAHKPPRWYSVADMEPLNLARHPMWVFDLHTKSMWWANTAALEQLWDADSLEEFVARDFSDMSVSATKRCEEYLERLADGSSFTEMWTYYPKGKAISLYVTLSRIYLEDGRMAIISETEPIEHARSIESAVVRATEIIRHLPVAVGLFDERGNSMEQNSAALTVFGGRRVCDCGPTSKLLCVIQNRFLSRQQGDQIWKQVMEDGEEFNGEIQQKTQHGVGWFAVQLRRSIDPVTGKRAVLYSARDISAEIDAKNKALAMSLAKQEAEQANQAKSEFVAVMAHEMRTPLHQVLGFLELLQETELSDTQTEYLELVETSASALMAVVNDLLDFTRLEAGKMKMESIRMDACGVALRSMMVLEPKGIKKGLQMTSHIDDGIPPVLGDPSRLRQILLNFFGNAVKFTSKGGIHLRVERKPHPTSVLLRFTVSDTGIGVHPDHCQHIFEKYQQANASIARRYGGTGLGLAICKIIVETLGGDIGVESTVGKGSHFWFEIPYQESLTQRRASVRRELIDIDRPLHVLVAEDNKVNQKLMASILKRLGHTTTMVANGRLAVEAVLSEERFDVVLMDIQMPDMDGMEATQIIRKSGWSLEQLPILGLTAEFNTANLYKYTDVGMNDCLGKPVKMDVLKERLMFVTD